MIARGVSVRGKKSVIHGIIGDSIRFKAERAARTVRINPDAFRMAMVYVRRNPLVGLLIRFGFARSNGRHAGVCFGA